MRARFSKAHIEISSICNLQCSFCPEVIREKKLMEVSLFREILEQVAPLTEQVALHLMGDPLVHPKLGEIIDACEDLGSKIFLVTNGTLLNEKRAGLLLRAPFRQVNFSLHSFPDNFPETDPREYLERIFSWTERAFADRPDLYVNYRLWNLASPSGTGDKNRDILRLIETRFAKSLLAEALSMDVREQKSLHVQNRLYLHFDTEFTWPSLGLPVLGTMGTCYGLSSHFSVLVDGTVVPCCLDKEGNIPLGNIREAPLSEILGGHRAQAMLKGFHERRLLEDLCRRCQYIKRFD